MQSKQFVDRLSNRKKTMRTKVFVSYSHVDAEWLKRLQVHLKPLERQGLVERWDDTRIAAGQKWQTEIRNAIDSAAVAILLISADFLASDFIDRDELPPLFKRRRNQRHNYPASDSQPLRIF